MHMTFINAVTKPNGIQFILLNVIIQIVVVRKK